MRCRSFRCSNLVTIGAVVAASLWGLTSPAHSAQNSKLTDEALAQKECGACHYFYAGGFLPAYSWKLVMDHLDNHFGEDASLDPASRRRILRYLANNRSQEIPAHVTVVPLRVTDMTWWTKAHGPRIREAAKTEHFKVMNCNNCHGFWKLSPIGGAVK